jgi:hypothetical protein
MLVNRSIVDFDHYSFHIAAISFRGRDYIANEQRVVTIMSRVEAAVSGNIELPGSCACVDTNHAILPGVL